MATLASDIVALFRAQAAAELAVLDSGWATLAESRDGALGLDLLRRVHRLKGDARVVGASEIVTLCQRIEDLLMAARRRDYCLSEELDLGVTMAMHLLSVLLDRQSPSGVDLDGFLAQTSALVVEGDAAATATAPVSALPPAEARLAGPTRERLRALALQLYLEQLRAAPDARARLHELWRSLDALVVEDSVSLESRIAHHVGAARALARQLGRQVRVALRLGDERVPSGVAEAINTALTHLLSNAIDHGLEPAAERTAAGKEPAGLLRIEVEQQPDRMVVTVDDDGRGVDFAKVRERGVAAGLVEPELQASEVELTFLLFCPGFSLRDEASGVSGRGLGLDAVRVALQQAKGGVSLRSERGRGTTVVMTLPLTPRRLPVLLFDGPVPVCVPASYTVTPTEGDAERPLAALGIDAPADHAFSIEREGARWRWRLPAQPIAATCDRRFCREPDAVEVVFIDGRDALLLRPQPPAG